MALDAPDLYIPYSHVAKAMAQAQRNDEEFWKASYGPDTGPSVVMGPAGGLDRLIRERGGEHRHADKALYYSLYTKHPFVYGCVELICQTAAQDRHTYPADDDKIASNGGKKQGKPTEMPASGGIGKAKVTDDDDDLEPGSSSNDPSLDGVEFLEQFFGSVNPFENFQDLLQAIYRDLLISGEAYILKQRNGAKIVSLTDDGSLDSEEAGVGRRTRVVSDTGEPVVALYRVPSRDTWAVPGPDGYPKVYRQRADGGGYREYAKEDIVFIRLPDPNDPSHGLSPLEALDLTLATDLQAARYNEAFFRNGAKAGLILSMQGASEPEIRRNREWVHTEYVKPENAHRPMLLLGNVEMVRDGNRAQNDMEFLELRRFTREEVCAVYSVPLSKLLSEGGSLGQAGKMSDDITFRADTVGPLQSRVYENINRQLMLPEFPDKPRLIPPKQEKIRLDLLEAAKSLVMCGGTGNEARSILHLAPFPEDELMNLPLFLVPSVQNLQADAAGAPDPDAPAKSPGASDAQRPDRTSRRTAAGQLNARVKQGHGMKTRS